MLNVAGERAWPQPCAQHQQALPEGAVPFLLVTCSYCLALASGTCPRNFLPSHLHCCNGILAAAAGVARAGGLVTLEDYKPHPGLPRYPWSIRSARLCHLAYAHHGCGLYCVSFSSPHPLPTLNTMPVTNA